MRHLSIFTLLLFAMVTSSCTLPNPPQASFTVTQVNPDPIQVGAAITILGRGFGNEVGWVSITARPLTVINWSDEKITAEVPIDTPRGETVLVVSLNEQQTTPFNVVVTGEPGERPSNPPVIISDASMPSPILRDMSVDMRDAIDMQSDMNPSDPALTLTLDQPDATVTMGALLGNERNGVARDELHISIYSKNRAWGIASHLVYPEDRLAFIGTLSDNTRKKTAKISELPDKRVFWYAVEARDEKIMTLRFRLKQIQNEQRLDFRFVPRFSALRTVKNESIEATWSNAVVQITAREF